MGVTYKLKDEVVDFIIGQRRHNPFFSCRQLAESASLEFGVRLSKSSVHDVLKESGVITPRGRKPKDKFQIPYEKKKQIQGSLEQIARINPDVISVKPQLSPALEARSSQVQENVVAPPSFLKTPVYEGAGKIFLKAALWDLGIFFDEVVPNIDWDYYLTYAAGITVTLEDKSTYDLDFFVPLHRAIREVADGLINNIQCFRTAKMVNEALFIASMEAQTGKKINKVVIFDNKKNILCSFGNLMDFKRDFLLSERLFAKSLSKEINTRVRDMFFSQDIDIKHITENIALLSGFDSISPEEYMVTLIPAESGSLNREALESSAFGNQENNETGSFFNILKRASERVNAMYLSDEQNRVLKINIQGELKEG